MDSDVEPIPITSQKHDPAWKHCQMFKNGERVQLKCVYCSKVFKGGGIHRIKEHLAGQKGNASTCLCVPPDVRLAMQQSLDVVVVKKRKKQKIAEEITNLNHVGDEIVAFGSDHHSDVNSGMDLIGVPDATEPSSSSLICQGGGMSGKIVGRRKKGRGRTAVENANAIVSIGNGTAIGGKRVDDNVSMAVGRFLFDIGAPLDAVRSDYFQPMVDAITSAGSDVAVPSLHDLRGWILKSALEEVKNDVDKHTATWQRTGCSVLVNQSNTLKGGTLLSIFVYCPEGMVFLKSVDSSDIVKSPDALYEYLKQVVEEIGVSHVLQVITRMEEQYIIAGKKLSDTFPTLFWAPCAAHCIDLILEDFAKLEWIKAAIEQARSITTFIYNHSIVLNMVRRYTYGLDLVEPGVTQCATSFATLRRMLDLKHSLQTMVTSQEWMDCPYSKKPEGLEMLDVISSQPFWSSCTLLNHLTSPLLQVLRLVVSKKRPAMGYVCAGLYRAKEAIKKELIKREAYMVYWNIIDHWWEPLWNLPLHAAGFYLNPKFFYCVEGDMHSRILSGMYDCIEKLVPDIKVQDKIIKEINSYKNAAGDFGRKMAIRSRDTLLPAEWWSTYGGSCPNLMRLAIRILSQTCSSVAYKRNEIPFERTLETKNYLERQRLGDLVFVQHNLRLRHNMNKSEEQETLDPISFDCNSVLEDWIKGKELCPEDDTNMDWMALDPPSANLQLLGPAHEEVEDLGSGFDDHEIFSRSKDSEEEIV